MVGQNCGSADVAAPGERPLSRSCRGCRRNEWRSEIPSPFRVISRVCEEENFPPLQPRHPKRSLPLPGHEPRWSVIRRLTRLAPLGFAAVGLTSGSHAGARSWGLEPSGAIPFPGADSVFSSWPAVASTARGVWSAAARVDAASSRFVPYLGGQALPGPYHFRARIQSFQAFAAPFAGDSAWRCAPRAMGRFPRALRARREDPSALRRRNRDSDRARARSRDAVDSLKVGPRHGAE